MSKEKPKIDPITFELIELFTKALSHQPPLPVTAYCLDIARSALGWELAGDTKTARREAKMKAEKI